MRFIDLTRKPRGIRIKPLTKELAIQLQSQANLAINGDGTCSLTNMTTSCFASENCANGHSALQLDMLVVQPHAYVAVADIASDGVAPLQEDVFVGCVTASYASTSKLTSRLFPHVMFEQKGLLLSNLCVSDDYRRHGIGRKLVDTIFNIKSPVVYLLISRNGVHSTNRSVNSAYHSRVDRLKTTYDKLGFNQQCECNDATLMCYKRV